MTDKQKRTHRKKRRGAVEAPGEFGFASGDTPKPGAAGPSTGDAPSGDRLTRLWGGIKLAVGLLVVVAASGAIAWGAHRFALTTPRFSVVEFAVEGNRRVSDDRVVRAAGLEAGRNIFEIDLDAAEQALLSDPWIESVRVARQLPGTVRIEMAERQAAAVAVLGTELYLVDTSGLPFKRLEPDDPKDLPVITGLTPEGFALDRIRELERSGHALSVLEVYDALPMARVHPPEEVHLEPDGTTVLVVGRDGLTLHLGHTDFRRKLAMAARVVGRLQAKGAVPGVVFLDNEAHEERVVVRMR